MSIATVTSKGQITIPADVRQALQVEAGDRVGFLEAEPICSRQRRVANGSGIIWNSKLSRVASSSLPLSAPLPN